MERIVIDAKGRAPGRVATEVVSVLTGKGDAAWAPHRLPDIAVTVINAAAIRISPRVVRSKLYRRHSQHPGGFREEPVARLFARHPEEVLRKAVYGMLPRNRLRARALRHLSILAGGEK